jgi:ribulose bisphosphate carboxylase small subunit
MIITVTYVAKWQLKSHTWYKWTVCKKLINTRTGREIMKTLKGNRAGYYIDRRFVKLVDMKCLVELIVDDDCPF